MTWQILNSSIIEGHYAAKVQGLVLDKGLRNLMDATKRNTNIFENGIQVYIWNKKNIKQTCQVICPTDVLNLSYSTWKGTKTNWLTRSHYLIWSDIFLFDLEDFIIVELCYSTTVSLERYQKLHYSNKGSLSKYVATNLAKQINIF